VLRKGMIRCIGDGNMTDIWRDRWILMHFDAKPLTPGDGQMVTMVSDLLTESGDWNEMLIHEIFIPSMPTQFSELQ
jgi:hypothetical protein